MAASEKIRCPDGDLTGTIRRVSSSPSVRRRPRPAPTDAADRADLAGVLRGDEPSFERLVARHHAALRRLAASHGVAGDAARPALARTWRAFLAVIDAAEPVVGVRALLTALLLDELAVGRDARPGAPRAVAGDQGQRARQACRS